MGLVTHLATRRPLAHRRTGLPWTRHHPKAQEGFTLVELLVSLVILSVGIMGVAQLFNISSSHTMSGDKELAAASLVQEMREKILSETFDDVPSIFDGVDTDIENSVSQPCEAWAQHITDHLGVEGRGQIDILEPDDDPEVLYGMLGAVITVSWPEQGETRDLTLRFVTTKIGP